MSACTASLASHSPARFASRLCSSGKTLVYFFAEARIDAERTPTMTRIFVAPVLRRCMAVRMKRLFLGSMASLLPFVLSACAVETGVHRGRMALLYGDPQVAVASFQSAVELGPDYLYFSVLPQGTWTYLGRAEYAAGRYSEARQLWNGRRPSTRKTRWQSFTWGSPWRGPEIVSGA